MKITKTNPLLSIVNDFQIDSPAASNISYFWSFGSLLGLNLVQMIITGIFQAMNFAPNVTLAFNSCEHQTRDVDNGWILRYFHANGASFFFAWVYLHIGRGLFYGSYRSPRAQLWVIGCIIQIAMMATAFIGYVQPWGQMSQWGATVIINQFSAIPYIGGTIVEFIWGGFSVDNPTLNRFFSQHFLQPFVLAAQVICHQIALHVDGSNNPVGISSITDKIRFHPYFTSKDQVGFFQFAIQISYFVFFYPNYLGHPDNSIPANPLVTPAHIQPEWYFLPFYAIQRSVPDKQGGVVQMFQALLIQIPLAFIQTIELRSNRYRPQQHVAFWVFCFNFLFLLWLGGCPVEQPYVTQSLLSTVLYFGYFFLIMALG